jgi:hypothetical protein
MVEGNMETREQLRATITTPNASVVIEGSSGGVGQIVDSISERLIGRARPDALSYPVGLQEMKAEYDSIRSDIRIAVRFLAGGITLAAPVLTIFFTIAHKEQIGLAFVSIPFLVIIYLGFVYTQRYSLLAMTRYCANLESRINSKLSTQALNWESSGIAQQFYSSWVVTDPVNKKKFWSVYPVFNVLMFCSILALFVLSLYDGYYYLLKTYSEVHAFSFVVLVGVLSLLISSYALYTEAKLPKFADSLISHLIEKRKTVSHDAAPNA